jgi:hypothetical protein
MHGRRRGEPATSAVEDFVELQLTRDPERVAPIGTFHDLPDLPDLPYRPVMRGTAQAGTERLTKRKACMVNRFAASMAAAGGSITVLL